MLSEFELIDFKSFDQATLQFGTLEQGVHRFSPLTVLIGANASGKSNLIDGLRLLSLIARGYAPGYDTSRERRQWTPWQPRGPRFPRRGQILVSLSNRFQGIRRIQDFASIARWKQTTHRRRAYR